METNYYTSKNKYINIQYRVSLETPILSSFQLCKNAIKIQNDIKQLNGHLNYNNHKIIEKELNDFYFNSLLFLSQLNNNDLKKTFSTKH